MFDDIKKNILPVALIVIAVIAAGSYIYVNKDKASATSLSASEILSADQASNAAMKFINESILEGKSSASLKGIGKENGLYKMKFNIEGQDIDVYITLNGKILFPDAIEMKAANNSQETIGSFTVTNDQLLEDNGKPIVYFFGSSTCPYCQWEHPVVLKVMEKFKDQVSLHDNFEATDKDLDVFSKYSTGGIPLVVLGGKYYRVGSGEQEGEETEIKNLTALVCKLTNNNPEAVCNEVTDLISQIP